MSPRAAAPAIGVVLLVALTVVTAVGVGAFLSATPPDDAPAAAFDCSASPDGTITVTHRGGDAVDPARLRVRISVDGRRLAEQPPVPFFSAAGFHSGPTGPFNSAYSGAWTAGETASLRVASTNAPAVRAGATVEIRMYAGDRLLAVLETTV